MIKNDNVKIVFVKCWILFAFLWLLLLCFVGFAVESGLKPEWETFYVVVILSDFVIVIIMVFLMSKIDIAPSKVNPIKKSIGIKKYVEFKQLIFEQTMIRGYDEPYSIPTNEKVQNTIAFKKTHGATYVVQTIWMNDFDIELLDMATEAFWKETICYVGEDKIKYQAIGLIQCVCVQRANGAFRKYITQNVNQEYKRYQVLVAISMGGRKAYICQTKGGFFRGYYRYLRREFDSIAENIWNLSEK